jgi:hypothetical protein
MNRRLKPRHYTVRASNNPPMWQCKCGMTFTDWHRRNEHLRLHPASHDRLKNEKGAR